MYYYKISDDYNDLKIHDGLLFLVVLKRIFNFFETFIQNQESTFL